MNSKGISNRWNLQLESFRTDSCDRWSSHRSLTARGGWHAGSRFFWRLKQHCVATLARFRKHKLHSVESAIKSAWRRRPFCSRTTMARLMQSVHSQHTVCLTASHQFHFYAICLHSLLPPERDDIITRSLDFAMLNSYQDCLPKLMNLNTLSFLVI